MTSKELTLEGNGHVWQVVVHTMTLRMSMASQRIANEMLERPVSSNMEQVLQAFFYPVMAACTTCEAGNVPTIEEFLDMPIAVANAWYAAVRELNPEALPESLGEAPVEQPEEKKEN